VQTATAICRLTETYGFALSTPAGMHLCNVACRGLFERHKLLLSLQMCVRILQSASQVNGEEWQFFLKGGQVLDRGKSTNML